MQEPTVGMEVSFSKTVGESDVYAFAGISGDFSPNHIDHEYMSRTRYGQRIAHGVLTLAFMSTCSSKLIESLGNSPTVSYGYDGVRFIKPVFIGDTLTIRYTVVSVDSEAGRSSAKVTVENQNGELVSAATHILKRV
ncbi:MaoC family dehydratase [Amycolatopsis palatopharyngis]|uniref:MaoC family dehydratase n=1 Tax=Amycolatopsis palatopharyngis TaxID=187982 RepID=UPI001FE97B9A|nr:MaoC family dehydratase [Amycolatopsis palatopharyngis]